MSDAISARRFTLRRVDARTWIISEAAVADRPDVTVAHIALTNDDIVEVTWSATLPLPVSYATPQDALESLEVWAEGRTGSTKPIPIPHLPPQ